MYIYATLLACGISLLLNVLKYITSLFLLQSWCPVMILFISYLAENGRLKSMPKNSRLYILLTPEYSSI